eukprot:TRINITY_DN6662_c0_g1_i1.p1 TRINITY_DN6662_c0_g1~~TRINITY_DN6662_c0_g1_i1.p1  ORF type:complete len:260 (+),score=8.32 TRINITY_DN6662_c0_g1_i1:79-858(+)
MEAHTIPTIDHQNDSDYNADPPPINVAPLYQQPHEQPPSGPDISPDEELIDVVIDTVLYEFKMPENSGHPLRGMSTPVQFIKKSFGDSLVGPPRYLHPAHQIWSSTCIFVTVLILALMEQFAFKNTSISFLIASYASSSLLVFTLPNSPSAQPRAIIGGYFLCSFTGVTFNKLLGWYPQIYWLTCCISSTIAVLLMSLTKTFHPPAASMSLLPIAGSILVKEMGYVFPPICMLGATIIIVIALIGNSYSKMVIYPEYWW